MNLKLIGEFCAMAQDGSSRGIYSRQFSLGVSKPHHITQSTVSTKDKD